jgi:beta-glucanase (GH16 family)
MCQAPNRSRAQPRHRNSKFRFADDFHIWTFEWGTKLLRFYLDDQHYWQVKTERLRIGLPKAKEHPVASCNQPFSIMANLVIGGKLEEDTNDKGIAMDSVPSEFVID